MSIGTDYPEGFPVASEHEFRAEIRSYFQRIEEHLHKLARLSTLIEGQNRLILEHANLTGRKMEQIMSQIDDLTTSVANVQSDVSAVAGDVTTIGTTVTQTAADIQTAIGLLQGAGSDNPQIADAISKLNDAHATLTTAAQQLTDAGSTLTASDTALGDVVNAGSAKASPSAMSAGVANSGQPKDSDGRPIVSATDGPHAHEAGTGVSADSRRGLDDGNPTRL